MISWDEFGRLRLAEFADDTETSDLDNWKFLGRVWLGHCIGFGFWMRLASDPGITRWISLPFWGLSETFFEAVLRRLHLPLSKGASVAQIEACFGRPRETIGLPSGGRTLCYTIGTSEEYDIECTVNGDGLVHLMVIRADYKTVDPGYTDEPFCVDD